jgi:tetratricopeptide (TPR) repeat protein
MASLAEQAPEAPEAPARAPSVRAPSVVPVTSSSPVSSSAPPPPPPLAHGAIVEIHSLSSASAVSLNGQLGEVGGALDAETERFPVHLLREKRKLAVKPEHLRRPTRVPQEQQDKSVGMAHAAAVKLAALQELMARGIGHARGNRAKEANALYEQALSLLFTALEDDPLNWTAYHTFGDLCTLQRQHADAVPHYRRAAENGGGDRSRQSLAQAIEQCGDAV